MSARARADGTTVVWAIAALLAILPIVGIRYLPIQDLPFHEGTIRIFASYTDASFGLRDVYALAPGKTQYVLFYFGGALLSKIVGVRFATHLMIAFYLGGTVVATGALLRALGKNELGSVFVIPLLYNKPLLIGFLPFLIGIPLLLFCLAQAIAFLEAPTRKNTLWLVALTLLLFLSHIAPFFFFWFGFAALTLASGVRNVPKAALVSLPALAVFALWLFGTDAGLATRQVFTERGDAPWTFDQVFRDTYGLVFDVFRDTSDEAHILAYAGLGIVTLGLAQGDRDERSRSKYARVLVVLPLLALVMFLRASHRVGYVAHIKDRFPILLMFTLVPLFRLPTGMRGKVAVFLALIVGVSSAFNVRRHFAEASRTEAGGLDNMIALLPPRATVAGLIFQPSSRIVNQSPWLHAAHWATVDKGAIVQFSFVGYPHWPVEYRPGQRVLGALEVGEGFSWSPQSVDVKGVLAPNFDYVLTRGEGFHPPPGTFAPFAQDSGWSLYKNTTR